MDDFDDFGGFEEAEAVAPSVASQPALFDASAPWVFLDGQVAVSSQQPDLLIAKDTFPLCLEKPGGHDVFPDTDHSHYGDSGLVGPDSISANMYLNGDDANLYQGERVYNNPDLVDQILDRTATHSTVNDPIPFSLQQLSLSSNPSLPSSSTHSGLPNVCGGNWANTIISGNTSSRNPDFVPDNDEDNIVASRNLDFVCNHGEDDITAPRNLDFVHSHGEDNITAPRNSNFMSNRGEDNIASTIFEDNHSFRNSSADSARGEYLSAANGLATDGDVSNNTQSNLPISDLDDIEWIARGSNCDHGDYDRTDGMLSSSHAILPNEDQRHEGFNYQMQIRFEREINEFKSRNEELEVMVGKCQEDLKLQKEKFSELQEKHSKEIADIRRAGEETLATISEQYQEALKLALLEQQTAFKEKLSSVTSQLISEMVNVIKDQKEESQTVVETERVKQEKIFSELSLQHNVSVKNMIKEEIHNSKEILQSHILDDIKTEQRKLTEELEQTLKQERQNHEDALSGLKLEFQNSQKEEREQFEIQLNKTLESQSMEYRNMLHEAVGEERSKRKEIDRTVEDITKAEVKSHLNELSQTFRLRQAQHMTSLGLFLRGAQQQLEQVVTSMDDLAPE